MSQKRTHDQMSGTNNKNNEKQAQAKPAYPYMSLLQTLEGVDTVILKVKWTPHRQWTVPRNLLRNASAWLNRSLQDPRVASIKLPWGAPDAHGLFFQWLYFGSYREQDGYALDFTHNAWGLGVEHSKSPNNMEWSIKAAFLAYEFGRQLEAIEFQNYAMARLIQAYSIVEPKAMITPDMFRTARYSQTLTAFLEDILIRNWGDDTVVNHGSEEWSEVFEDKTFRKKFVQAMATTLVVRQQKTMVLAKYLVKEK